MLLKKSIELRKIFLLCVFISLPLIVSAQRLSVFEFNVRDVSTDESYTVKVDTMFKRINIDKGSQTIFSHIYEQVLVLSEGIAFSFKHGETPSLKPVMNDWFFSIKSTTIGFYNPTTNFFAKADPINPSSFTSTFKSLCSAIKGGGTMAANGVHLSCPDSQHPHVIDMGNAGKWACCNVGASTPWEYGGHYAWGEINEKSDYSEKTYTKVRMKKGSDIAGTNYDVAHVKWGGSWRMPSLEQIKLLLSCHNEQTRVNGVLGFIFTGSTGNSIFLPQAGKRKGDKGIDEINPGYYWSSSPDRYDYSFSLDLCGFGSSWSFSPRCDGISIRPVAE